MSWLLFGILLLGVALVAVRFYVNADPHQLGNIIRYTGAAVLGLLALRLLAAGQLVLAGPMAAAALLLIRRRPWPGFKMPGWADASPGQASPGRVSTVDTDYLSMTLDHDAGTLDGQVLKGRFAGRALGALSMDELMDLLSECRAGDPEAAALLESFLDRAKGAEWRAGDGGETEKQAPPESVMTPEQALAVLGLEAGAGEREIRRAHRELMKKLHPDHGGTSYLAAKINQAKDMLIGK